MATRAYVLMTTEPGNTGNVAQAVRKLAGVTAADVVTGNYDLVVVVEQPDVRDIGHLVMGEIRGLPGVKATTTLIAVA